MAKFAYTIPAEGSVSSNCQIIRGTLPFHPPATSTGLSDCTISEVRAPFLRHKFLWKDMVSCEYTLSEEGNPYLCESKWRTASSGSCESYGRVSGKLFEHHKRPLTPEHS